MFAFEFLARVNSDHLASGGPRNTDVLYLRAGVVGENDEC